MSSHLLKPLLVLLLALFGVVAIAQKPVVKPGDVVKVVCEEEPSLSKEYTITRDGYIVLQFVGAINVAGLTEEMAAAKIASALVDQRILTKATVTLKLAAGGSNQLISYAGAVRKTGEMVYREGMRLSDVIKEAQPTEAADLEKVRITAATGRAIVVNYKLFDGKKLEYNPEVRPGDRVFFELIQRPMDVTIVGHVDRPGLVAFEEGMTVESALAKVGGLLATADAAKVTLERKGKEIPVAEATFATVRLEPGDVLRVPQLSVLEYVTVSGAVRSPKRVPYKDGLKLGQAVQEAGGLLLNANAEDVKIRRVSNGRSSNLKVNLEQIQKGMIGDFPLEANDVVEVSFRSGRKRDNLLIQIAAGILLGWGLGIIRF